MTLDEKPICLCDRCDCEIPKRALRTALGLFGKDAAGENAWVLLCSACVKQAILLPVASAKYFNPSAYILGDLGMGEDFDQNSLEYVEPADEIWFCDR